MTHWMHRYVFRGIGILLAAGMITMLYFAIHSHSPRTSSGKRAPETEGATR